MAFSRLEHVLEVAESALKERAFTLDLEAIWPELANSSSPWVRKILRYLSENENFLHIKSVQEVADHFGITEAHLLRNFDRCFPFSLKQLLLCLKLCYAAWLRETTTLRIDDIALICGFYDGHHLSRLFRQKLGCPVSNYPFEQSWQKALYGFNNNLQIKRRK
jgi:AraC-like DNA-binding protein